MINLLIVVTFFIYACIMQKEVYNKNIKMKPKCVPFDAVVAISVVFTFGPETNNWLCKLHTYIFNVLILQNLQS